MTCLDKVIATLEESISDAIQADVHMTERAEMLIRTIQSVSRQDSRLNKLYNEITHLSEEQNVMNVKAYAEQVEGASARAYAGFLQAAKDSGDIRPDADVDMFAFFLDSLLVTLQFSYTCDYYRERLKVYCGTDILEDDDRVVTQLVNFLESAFAFSHEEVVEKNEREKREMERSS